jgi:hypothetical protein
MFGVLLLPVDGSICKPSAETNFEEGTSAYLLSQLNVTCG